MNLTDFLIFFFDVYGNNSGQGNTEFPALFEIEIMEEACIERTMFSFWKEPKRIQWAFSL